MNAAGMSLSRELGVFMEAAEDTRHEESGLHFDLSLTNGSPASRAVNDNESSGNHRAFCVEVREGFDPWWWLSNEPFDLGRSTGPTDR